LLTIVVALLCLWLIVFGFLLSSIEERRAQITLYAGLREELADPEVYPPIGGLIPAAKPVALINAPEGGLHDVVVVEGTSSAELRSGPGHKRDTPMPGQPGISEIFGRSTTFGGPFGGIAGLKIGSKISVVTGQGTFEYVVERLRYRGDPISPPAAGASRLTLVTSEGGGWRSGWAPSSTIYVDAVLDGKTQVAPPGRPSYVPENEQPMHGSTGGLASLVLWLEALVAVVVLSFWAARRWKRLPVALLGGVCALALLWITTDVASGLLPNLI